ncbi:hypothetical protein FQR65_LT08195 [Abscondita terminalis]|nr:hypothetical protein FQR65_LT08195 [Abscondita terminalis]
MKMSVEEFVSQFETLQGANVGEIRKNLFRLLNNFRENDFDDFNFLRLQPKNVLEENFKISVLIYFKRVPELLTILKSENPEHIERVFKIDRWFFQRAFGNVTGKDLVEGLFPFVSFNVKVKLLNKLSEILTNTQQANGIFNEVENVYGLYLASKILPACSFDLIIELLETRKLKLPPKQMKLLMKKHPENRDRLLKTIERSRIEKEYNNVLKLLKEVDLSCFLTFHKTFWRKLGRRTTAKFCSLNREAVIEDSKRYLNILHNKQIVKSLGEDFHKFFENLFPDNIEDFMNDSKLILSKLNLLSRKEDALELYFSTFKLKYGSEIWDHPELITIKLLKKLDPEEKDKRIKDEYRPSGVTEDEWMCLYNVQTSVPFLKKRILLTSDVKIRAQLVGYLVDTCKINQDVTALADICKYVLSKHRNDNIRVRLTFLRKMQSNFVLENLEEEHWEHINELIDIFHMNQELFHFENGYLEAYIHYRLRNNLVVNDYLNKWLAKNKYNLNLIKSVPSFEKKCLQIIGEIVSEVAKDHTLLVRYLGALHDYNCRNEKDQIQLFDYPRAIEALKENVSKYAWDKTVFAILIAFLKNVNSREKSEYLKLVLSASNRYSECNTIDNLLKNEPALILENIEGNPDDYIWNILKISVENLDESDRESFDLFMQINKIPKEYLLRYQVYAWNILLKFPNEDLKRAWLLNSIDNEGSQMLPVDFSRNIINSWLFCSEDVDDFQISVQMFTCKYIIYCKDRTEKQNRLKCIFALMKVFIESRRMKPQHREATRSCSSLFVQTFCSEFLNNRSDDQEILQNFFKMWNGLFSPHEAFSDYLHLKFTLMHIQVRSLEQFSKDFLVLCNDLTARYGLVIVELLHNEFNMFIGLYLSLRNTSGEEVHTPKTTQSNTHRYEFIENLVKHANSDVGLLIAILFLRGSDRYDSEVSDRRNRLIEKLANNKKTAKMGLTTKEFVIKFHNLAGITAGERRKKLSKLLNDNVNYPPDFSKLIPQSLFEQSLKFEVLKFYKSKDNLLEMMKDENQEVIEKILNLNWFVKETFESMTPNRLTSEMFPNLSYNSKIKLLKKMSLLVEDSNKCDEFFWSINEAYGKYLALTLLPACTETLILKIMEDDRVQLTAKQLLFIIKRNPSITEQLFERLHSYNRNAKLIKNTDTY